jgi:hypothetical protein
MKFFVINSIVTIAIITSFFAVHAQGTSTVKKDPLCANVTSQCCDGIDNDGDGKYDFYGAIGEKDGKTIIYPSDPSCIDLKPETIEKADLPQAGKLIPCVNKCSFPDVIRLINNLLQFLITTIFLPLFVLVFIYAGYQYLTAQGNSTKVANVKKLIMNVVIGLVIVLTAWLVVKVLFQTIGVEEGLLFLE